MDQEANPLINCSDYDLIWEFQRRLVWIYKNENLTCIAGLDHKYCFEGMNLLSSYFEAMRLGQRLYAPETEDTKSLFDHLALFKDLTNISSEILHFTGLTILYSRYLSSFKQIPYEINHGGGSYSFLTQMPDFRFFSYAGCAVEKLYNFWDRIADLISSYFPEYGLGRNIYFSKIDKIVPKEYHALPGIDWLIKSKAEQYNSLSELRNKLVHDVHLLTEFQSGHLANCDDIAELKRLTTDRSELVPKLKEHMYLAMDGVAAMIQAMCSINESTLSNSEIYNHKRRLILSHG